MKFYLFAKNFQHLSLERMMEITAACGFDGPTALIRNGFWISRADARRDLAAYVKTAQRFGLEVRYGSADISPDRLPEDEEQMDLLRCFAANGVRQVRLQHVPKREADDVRAYADRFRRQAEAAARAGERAGVQCIIQLHGHCYPHNATAAYAGVKDLDPRYIGIKLDPGNNVCQEGYELYWYQIRLLGEYLAALGAKDCAWLRTGDQAAGDKGWQPQWLPADEGSIDYPEVFRLLRTAGFDGPVIHMPFYAAPSDEEMIALVKRELAYFKRCAAGE